MFLDSEPACIRIVDSKTAAGLRTVWLTNHCREALVHWRELHGPEFSLFVFPSPRDPAVHFVDYKTAWRTAARKAGLADRRIYDLRSTFASRANVCHATGLTVAHLLGHASTQILPTYVRPFDDNTKALIEAMDSARKNKRAAPRLNQLNTNETPSGESQILPAIKLAISITFLSQQPDFAPRSQSETFSSSLVTD